MGPVTSRPIVTVLVVTVHLGHRKHLIGMAVDLHVAPDFRKPAIRSDQNRAANDSEKRLAIHGFFAPGAIGLQHLVLFIRDQRNRKRVLVAELLLGFQRIGRDAEDSGPTRGEGLRQAGEIDGFPGTAGGVGAGIEEQHQLPSGEVGQ
jgi:hypothetical protein